MSEQIWQEAATRSLDAMYERAVKAELERDEARKALHDIHEELTHGRTANFDYIDKRYAEGMGE